MGRCCPEPGLEIGTKKGWGLEVEGGRSTWCPGAFKKQEVILCFRVFGKYLFLCLRRHKDELLGVKVLCYRHLHPDCSCRIQKQGCHGSCPQGAQSPVSPLPLTSCVTSGKLRELSEPSSHLSNGDRIPAAQGDRDEEMK